MIKLICNNSPNCKYVNIALYKSRDSILRELCKKINIEFDSIYYKEKFLTFKNKEYHCTNPNTSKTSKYKKGTIPYYFQQKVKKINVEQKNIGVNPAMDSIQCEKGKKTGNIPYYYYFNKTSSEHTNEGKEKSLNNKDSNKQNCSFRTQE